MFTPMVEILIYLSSIFLLGLALGWSLWKFGSAKELDTMAKEVTFWKQYLEQSRRERDLDQDKLTALEEENTLLKSRLDTDKEAK